MRIVQKKLDFLVLYILISLMAFGVMRNVFVQLVDWLQRIPAVVSTADYY